VRRLIASAVAVAACTLALAGVASAAVGTVYVSPPGSASCGGGPTYTTISDGIAHAAPGDRVVVCPGTYAEDVVVDRSVDLVGMNATVQPDPNDTSSPLAGDLGTNAFTVLAANVSISGFTATGATGDGILLVGDHANVEHVLAQGNGGNGIMLESSSWSTVRGNRVTGNAGGIELANDAATGAVPQELLDAWGSSGTAAHDVVQRNLVVGNPEACGILLVDHAGVGDELGIHDNLIAENVVTGNAMHGFGGGVLLASPVPGGAVYDNQIVGNAISGNGLAGVTIHSHAPGQNFSGNTIVRNFIGTNNLKGAQQEPDDPETTGVFIGSQDPLSVTVAANVITGDHYGIFTAGPVTIVGGGTNLFLGVAVPFGSKPTYE